MRKVWMALVALVLCVGVAQADVANGTVFVLDTNNHFLSVNKTTGVTVFDYGEPKDQATGDAILDIAYLSWKVDSDTVYLITSGGILYDFPYLSPDLGSKIGDTEINSVGGYTLSGLANDGTHIYALGQDPNNSNRTTVFDITNLTYVDNGIIEGSRPCRGLAWDESSSTYFAADTYNDWVTVDVGNPPLSTSVNPCPRWLHLGAYSNVLSHAMYGIVFSSTLHSQLGVVSTANGTASGLHDVTYSGGGNVSVVAMCVSN